MAIPGPGGSCFAAPAPSSSEARIQLQRTLGSEAGSWIQIHPYPLAPICPAKPATGWAASGAKQPPIPCRAPTGCLMLIAHMGFKSLRALQREVPLKALLNPKCWFNLVLPSRNLHRRKSRLPSALSPASLPLPVTDPGLLRR